jgi:hypothetical protein
MSSLVTVGVGAGGAALGSLVTGYLLKAADRRAELRIAGRVEVRRQQHLDRHKTAKSLSGQLANLKHYLDHACEDENADSRLAYRERGERLCREIRGRARSEIYDVGPDVLSAIYDVTDRAQAILALGREDDSHNVGAAAMNQTSMHHGWSHDVDELAMRLQAELRKDTKPRWRR